MALRTRRDAQISEAARVDSPSNGGARRCRSLRATRLKTANVVARYEDVPRHAHLLRQQDVLGAPPATSPGASR